VVDRAAEWIKGHAILLVCDDLWATKSSELGYVHELWRLLRNAPQSRLLVSTRDRYIASKIAESPVNFEALEARGKKAREILGKTAFGADWQPASDSAGYEEELKGILEFCAGLALALGIAGSGIRSAYRDSRNEAAAVRKYWDGLQRKGLLQMRGRPKLDYHKDGLKYVAEASLSACDAWGRTDGRDYDMRRMFKSLCVLGKQQLMPETALTRYWSVGDDQVDEDQVDEVVEKFVDLGILEREPLERTGCTADDTNQASGIAELACACTIWYLGCVARWRAMTCVHGTRGWCRRTRRRCMVINGGGHSRMMDMRTRM